MSMKLLSNQTYNIKSKKLFPGSGVEPRPFPTLPWLQFYLPIIGKTTSKIGPQYVFYFQELEDSHKQKTLGRSWGPWCRTKNHGSLGRFVFWLDIKEYSVTLRIIFIFPGHYLACCADGPGSIPAFGKGNVQNSDGFSPCQ